MTGRRGWQIAAVAALVLVLFLVVAIVLRPGTEDGPAPQERPIVSDELQDVILRAAGFGSRQPYTSVGAADFVAAREAADLPADADPWDYEAGPETSQVRFAGVVNITSVLIDHDDPVARALDRGAILAVASSSGLDNGQIIVIRTTQDVNELTQALAVLGFEAHGDLLSAPADFRPYGIVHVAVSDGLIAMTGDRREGRRVRRAATETPPRTELGSWAIDAAAGAGAVTVLPHPDVCIKAMATTERYDGTGGDLILYAAGEPEDIDVVIAGRSSGEIDFGDPELHEDRVVVPASSDSPYGLIDSAWVSGDKLWRCAP